jgi:hypothetical protein
LPEKKLPVEIRALKYVPLEITVRNKVPSENIHTWNSFFNSYFQGNLKKTCFLELIAREMGSQ